MAPDPDQIQSIRNGAHYLGSATMDIGLYKWEETTGSGKTLTCAEDKEPARLSCITKITSQDYWLTSCGMWRGPTEMCPAFTSVKPTCTGRRPDEPTISDNYTHVLTNLRKLVNELHLKDKYQRKGLFTDWNGTGRDPKIKFRHVLFTIRAHEDDDEEEGDNLGPEFTLEQWPAHYEEGREAILDQQKTRTHKLHVLRAYDIEGEIIKPVQYQPKLEGALIRADFHLNYWRIKNKDLFAADIQAIRVLEQPRTTATKRTPLTPSDPGPSKKPKKD